MNKNRNVPKLFISCGDFMKLGMFGGSFNPPTNAHLKLALQTLKEFNLDKLIFVPVGDKYQKPGLISEEHRLNMLREMCKPYTELVVSDIELKLNKKLSTIDIFHILTKTYEKDELYFIMGADNIEKVTNEILNNFKIIILQRDNKNIIEHKNIYIIKNQEIMDCSSTKVRENINSDILPKGVYEYIINNSLY